MAKQSVLFIFNCELGQSTVALAVAYEFLLRSEYEVHIASFPALEKAVLELNNDVSKLSGFNISNKAIFHTIAGKSMKESAARKTEFIEMHQPGIRGALFAYQNVLPATLASWNGPEYMIGYSSVCDIINQVKPSFCCVDSLFSQGTDACNELGQKFCILSPNTFKDHVLRDQPKGAALWKYPQICTGFPYPMNWSYTLVNIYLTLKCIGVRSSHPRLRELTEYRHSCGIKGEICSLFGGHGDAPIVCVSTPAIDLPFFIPERVTGAGPILLPTLPIAISHPELASWLAQRPTVLVNLGSHILFDEAFASEFAKGLRVLFDRRPDIQVLWKLKNQDGTKDRLYSKEGGFQIIAKELADGRVRIEEWLPAQPIAILQSGNVICMVHHGGSNSYHEAIRYVRSCPVEEVRSLMVEVLVSPKSSSLCGLIPMTLQPRSSTSKSASGAPARQPLDVRLRSSARRW
jgi:hypothetical protein